MVLGKLSKWSNRVWKHNKYSITNERATGNRSKHYKGLNWRCSCMCHTDNWICQMLGNQSLWTAGLWKHCHAINHCTAWGQPANNQLWRHERHTALHTACRWHRVPGMPCRCLFLCWQQVLRALPRGHVLRGGWRQHQRRLHQMLCGKLFSAWFESVLPVPARHVR